MKVLLDFAKKMWPVLAVAAIFLISLLDWVNQNKSQQKAVTQVDFAMNTVISYCFYGENAGEALAQCRDLVDEMEHMLSATWANSDLLKIRDAAGKEPVPVSKETIALLTRALSLREETGGRFDVTIGPLVQLWDITGTDPKVPDAQEIEQALRLVGAVPVIDEAAGTVFLPEEGQQIDFGGIAKGYACSKLREICDTYQITNGYISLGGNMMVLGETDNLFGIRDPNGGENAYFAKLSLAGKTMATAGGYERYFEAEGKTYHHILNPHTGYPAETDLLSVSVISEDGALADALSTALFMMGREEADAYLTKHPEIQAVLADDAGTVWLYGDIPGFSLHEKAGYRLGTR